MLKITFYITCTVILRLQASSKMYRCIECLVAERKPFHAISVCSKTTIDHSVKTRCCNSNTVLLTRISVKIISDQSFVDRNKMIFA